LSPTASLTLSHSLQFSVTDTDYQSNFIREEHFWGAPTRLPSYSASPWLGPSGDQLDHFSTLPTNNTSFDPVGDMDPANLEGLNLANFAALNLTELGPSAPTVDFSAFDSSSLWDAYCESFATGESTDYAGVNPLRDIFKPVPIIDSGYVTMRNSRPNTREPEPFVGSTEGHENSETMMDLYASTGQPQESERESGNLPVGFDGPPFNFGEARESEYRLEYTGETIITSGDNIHEDAASNGLKPGV